MSPKSLIHILTVEEIDGDLQALSNQGGEEEEAEGHNLKHQQPPDHVDPGVADDAVLEAVLIGRRQGQADEDSNCEKRVYIDEAVEGGDVNAGGGGRTRK